MPVSAPPDIPADFPLIVPRWQDFVVTFDFVGVDLSSASGATFQVREFPDAQGSPVIGLTESLVNGEGVVIGTATSTDLIPTNSVTVKINETTINSVQPFPNSGVSPSGAINLYYGLKLSGASLRKGVWVEGKFTIVPKANKA